MNGIGDPRFCTAAEGKLGIGLAQASPRGLETKLPAVWWAQRCGSHPRGPRGGNTTAARPPEDGKPRGDPVKEKRRLLCAATAVGGSKNRLLRGREGSGRLDPSRGFPRSPAPACRIREGLVVRKAPLFPSKKENQDVLRLIPNFLIGACENNFIHSGHPLSDALKG